MKKKLFNNYIQQHKYFLLKIKKKEIFENKEK